MAAALGNSSSAVPGTRGEGGEDGEGGKAVAPMRAHSIFRRERVASGRAIVARRDEDTLPARISWQV